jgi:hypothetical protein
MYMARVKDFSGDSPHNQMYSANLSALCLIGTEYVKAESGFTESTLMELLRGRQVAGKSTILSSHLNPKEFADRYFSLDKVGATAMKFEDDGIVLTVDQLSKELDRIKKKEDDK